MNATCISVNHKTGKYKVLRPRVCSTTPKWPGRTYQIECDGSYARLEDMGGGRYSLRHTHMLADRHLVVIAQTPNGLTLVSDPDFPTKLPRRPLGAAAPPTKVVHVDYTVWASVIAFV